MNPFNRVHKYRQYLLRLLYSLHLVWLFLPLRGCCRCLRENLFFCRRAGTRMLIWRFGLRLIRMNRWNHTSRRLCFYRMLCSVLRWGCRSDLRSRINRKLWIPLMHLHLLKQIFWYQALLLESWRAHQLFPIDKFERMRGWKTLIYQNLQPISWTGSAWFGLSRS